jgi:hypothetical protein
LLSTAPLRGPDTTHERADLSEHLVPRSFTCVSRVPPPAARSKAT